MAREQGRDPAKIGSALYHNININEDRKAALDESKAFLDKYYTSNFSMKFVEGFTTAGSPKQCIEELKSYFDAGLEHITLRNVAIHDVDTAPTKTLIDLRIEVHDENVVH